MKDTRYTMKNFFKQLWLKTKLFLKKHGLAIQLTPIFIVVVIVSIALMLEAIDLPTSISIFAAFIAISVLLISINEIRNRLRPWVAVHEIDVNKTPNLEKEPTRFYIKNTGPIPATRMVYTAKWFLKEDDKWRQDERLKDWTLKGTQNTLFPNQQILHEASMSIIKTLAENRDIKVTFEIEYHGLWSKHTTTNSFKYNYQYTEWVIDEPQDYT